MSTLLYLMRMLTLLSHALSPAVSTGTFECPHLVISPLGPSSCPIFSAVLKGPSGASLSRLHDRPECAPSYLEGHPDGWTEAPAPELQGTRFHPSLPV